MFATVLVFLGEIYMTTLDFDDIWCVRLWSRVYTSRQILIQSDLHIQR